MSLTKSETWMSRRPGLFVAAGRTAFERKGRGVLVYLEGTVAAAIRSAEGDAPDPDWYLTDDAADLDSMRVPECVREWIRAYDPRREVLVAIQYGDRRVRAFRCTTRDFPKRSARRRLASKVVACRDSCQ